MKPAPARRLGARTSGVVSRSEGKVALALFRRARAVEDSLLLGTESEIEARGVAKVILVIVVP